MDHAEDIDDVTEFLPVGTELLNGTYRITDHLGAGGFGLTYLADDQIGRRVVLKECFPASFCRREGLNVRTQTEAQQENFDKLIKNFVNEARQLAKLKHPNVVPVLHFFEEHDTAYISLEYVKGDDLSVGLGADGKRLTPERVVEITTGMLRALDYIHSRGLLHRDIAPDNVIINEADQPVLIDFGASRNETAQAVTRLLSQQLRAVKDGYSPQEFYMPGRPHTPASDLYSLAATVYTLITGEVPIDAYNRLVDLSKKEPDPLRCLTGGVKGYPASFLAAIDRAMSLLPKDRPQSAEEMRLMIAPNTSNVTPIHRKAAEASADAPKREGPVAPKRPSREPGAQSVRPPAIDTTAPVREASQPRKTPSEPRRIVKPRVLTRSSEQPRAGTASVHPPAVASRAPEPVAEDAPAPVIAPTLPPTEPVVRAENAPETPVASTQVESATAPAPEVSGAPEGGPRGSTSVLDLVLRGAAIAVIAGGGALFFGGQISFTGGGPSVPPEVASFAAAPIIMPSDPVGVAPVQSPAAVAIETPAPTAPPTGVQTAWASNGWAVTLALPLVASESGVAFAKGGASPYPAGTLLVGVGGKDAGDMPTEIAGLAASYFSFADPDAPRLPVSVRNPVFDSRGDGEIRVDVSRVVEFGAFTLAQRPNGEGWAVTVATARPGSGLRDGDVVLSEASSGTPIGKISELEAIFDSYRERGAEEAVLLVERSGATLATPLKLADILPTGGAG